MSRLPVGIVKVNATALVHADELEAVMASLDLRGWYIEVEPPLPLIQAVTREDEQ